MDERLEKEGRKIAVKRERKVEGCCGIMFSFFYEMVIINV
jgi:hypothetical protein